MMEQIKKYWKHALIGLVAVFGLWYFMKGKKPSRLKKY